uniref:Uncharacterized protein n=1 Tax=viral metagenome TaxID=1070528 RepID=A0A6C0KTW6_9ZZZZ
MSEQPRKKTAAEMVIAARAKLMATRKNNGSRAASPVHSVSSRSTSASRGRTLANQLAHAETRAKLLREKEARASASSMSNQGALASKASKRSIHNEINSLERKVASLERSYAAKMQAAENYKDRRSNSRGRYEQESLAAPQWARPGVRTSQRKAANNKVEAINKEYKKMLRDAGVVETALRHARETLKKKSGKAEVLVASAASSRGASPPTGSVRSTSSIQSKRLTANEHEARAANLRRRLTLKQNRNRAAAKKKENANTKKLAEAYKKLEGFDDDVLDVFCEELRQRRRGAAGATAAARAVVRSMSPAASAAASNNNLNPL